MIEHDEDCKQSKPSSQRSCQSSAKCQEWKVGPWSKCNVACGSGFKSREVSCDESGFNETCDFTTKPVSTESCIERPCEGLEWVVSDWGPCDGICNGHARKSRIALCMSRSGNAFKERFCDADKKPETEKTCTDVTVRCAPVWHGTEWSRCSTDCGVGLEIRTVMCVIWKGASFEKVDESLCDRNKRLSSKRECSRSHCRGVWVTAPWEPCSVSCGDGDQRRAVFCMSGSSIGSDDACDVTVRPEETRRCNERACPSAKEAESCGNTLYGCCADGQTAAQGPDFFGCPASDRIIPQGCAFYEWGCCYDNVTPAKGPFKEGCKPPTW